MRQWFFNVSGNRLSLCNRSKGNYQKFGAWKGGDDIKVESFWG